MEEYEVRKRTKEFLITKINQYIESYITKYNNHIGYLFFYPIISVEYRFRQVNPDHSKAEIDRYAISWFLEKLFEKKLNIDLEFEYKEEEFNNFIQEELPVIKLLYSDFILCDEIMDMNSIAQSQLDKIHENKYKYTSAYIDGGFLKEYIYYRGLYNTEEFQLEREIKMKPATRIVQKYGYQGPKSYRQLKRLIIDIDMEILDLCNKAVQIDLGKLGGNVKSSVIKHVKELNLIIGYFYYNSLVIHNIYSSGIPLKKVSAFNLMFFYDTEWFINKAIQITGLSKGKVKKYIQYFVYEGKGSLLEFPILFQRNKLIFIPSSWMLNDFQFSIVNGHYYKKEKFKNRDKTISNSVVSTIIHKVQNFENILFSQEVYYEYADEDSKGGKQNSDIDVVLYDKKSNTFIIIECKWKDNHYLYAGEENYKKIHFSLNDIYATQINKHQTFINGDKKKLSTILGGKIPANTIDDNSTILYIAVDKRSQLYLDDRLLVPLYGLMALIEKYSENTILHLDKVVNDLKKQRTKAIYVNSGELKEYKVSSELIIVTDEFNA